MENYNFLLDAITTLAGVYALYVWFRMKRDGRLFENQLLIPKGCKPEECLDEEGYLAYFSPRMLVLGIVCFVTGAISAANTQLDFWAKLFPTVEKLGTYVDLGGRFVALVALIWYAICWTKARKEYWVTD